MNKILFRVDFSPTIGFGHIMRSMLFAQTFKNFDVYFASFKASEPSLIANNQYKLKTLLTDTVEEFIAYIQKLDPKIVIIDAYSIGYKEEKKIKERTNCKLMVLDDNYKKHYCDVLLNHNIYAKKEYYKKRVPPFCTVKCGEKFALLREEFKKEREIKRQRDGIFISIGATDATNITIDILKKLPKNVHINIATTSANAHLNELIAYVEKNSDITLHVNAQNMAKLINESKFAIISPSSIAGEVLYLNVPLLCVMVARNQRYMYRYLREKGHLCTRDIERFDFSKIEKFLWD